MCLSIVFSIVYYGFLQKTKLFCVSHMALIHGRIRRMLQDVRRVLLGCYEGVTGGRGCYGAVRKVLLGDGVLGRCYWGVRRALQGVREVLRGCYGAVRKMLLGDRVFGRCYLGAGMLRRCYEGVRKVILGDGVLLGR